MWKDGHAKIIPSLDGSPATAACVAFLPDGEVVCGNAALAALAAVPTQTVFARRILGKVLHFSTSPVYSFNRENSTCAASWECALHLMRGCLCLGARPVHSGKRPFSSGLEAASYLDLASSAFAFEPTMCSAVSKRLPVLGSLQSCSH